MKKKIIIMNENYSIILIAKIETVKNNIKVGHIIFSSGTRSRRFNDLPTLMVS